MKFSDTEAREAARLVHIYTAGTCNVWQLAGPAKASCRAHVMSALLGRRVPQSKAGVTALRDELYGRLQPQGDCMAARDESFATACRREFGQPEANAGGSVLRV